MRWKFLAALPLSALVIIGGCSGSSKLSISNPSKNVYLIPAQTFSCYARLQASSGTISYDISSKYFQLQGVSLSWADTTSTLYIATIFLKFTVPSTNQVYTCSIGGSELLAENTANPTADTSWYGTQIASIAPATSSGPTTIALSCPIICGGITTAITDGSGNSDDPNFTVNATMEVIGYSQNTTSGQQVPVQLDSYFDVINLAE